jgi:2-keto-4-pentenoate hydratase/2-oxohepta-3-ene-1,7-dioic acid hydratase in catechol pathway
MSARFARLAVVGGDPAWAELEGGVAWLLDDAPYRGGARTGERLEGVDDEGRGPARRLAPVTPSKIVCIGRNYRAHAAELGHDVPAEPLLFFKPPSALLEPDGRIDLPPQSKRVEHEAELGVVVGKRLRDADEQEAVEAIFGYTIVADVTARDLQRSDGQWSRAKGFDTFCPVGPVLVTGLDDAALGIRCTVSGELRQDGTTADMIFRPAFLLSYVSQAMTLEPGDLLATGTPEGVGPLVDGDRLAIAIDGIGELCLSVTKRPRV